MTEPVAGPVQLVAPVPDNIHRPLWSVMIPTYNPAECLCKTLQSVLDQYPGPERMQIEVVDNCSTCDDLEALVRTIGQGQVKFYRRPYNSGVIDNFNECIRRSRGQLVHILHSDDYVLPCFYAEIERLATARPDAALLATRCFYIDESAVINGVSPRIPELEDGGHFPASLYYDTLVQFPAVVIRRSFYEANGGFMSHIVHAADREMWARAISIGGGAISPHVLACYRVSDSNNTANLVRSGENIRDLLRLNEVFGQRYSDFSSARGRQFAAYLAFEQARKFALMNDHEAARNNWRLWRENALRLDRVKEALRPLARKLYGRAN